jgi:hypothetical protein
MQALNSLANDNYVNAADRPVKPVFRPAKLTRQFSTF